ncbi:MAG: ATP-binding protein [Clostridiaceae bacterium]|jgi:DNA replication protein DnaC|nr:ATP-binding protein [Clostridiaceae bacterium]HZW98024.1 ATP-binding protein [Bacillota bacterium]
MRELNREINQEIEREYALRRNTALAEAEKKSKAIHLEHPDILECEQAVNQYGISYLQASLGNNKADQDLAAKELEIHQERLCGLLKKYGLSPDYAEPKWHCSQCQDTGLAGNHYCSCYDKLRQEKLSRLLPSASLPQARFENWDLDLYPEEINTDGRKMKPREYMATLKDIVRTYCEYFSALENKNLFFSGQEGSGKSWVISSIAADIMEKGYTVFMLPAAVFFDLMQEWHQLKNSFRPDPDRFREMQLLTEALWDSDLLVLDDLGTEIQKDASYIDLLLLLDDRHRESLHTVIASNLSANDLRRVYDKRIASRISGNFLCYQLPYVDLRRRDHS